jgi:hypothetical protein
MDRAQQKLYLNKKIEDTTDALKQKAQSYKDLGRDALLIGGVLVFAYSLFQLFNDEEEEEDKVESTSKGDSFITTSLKGIATSVLLAIAKEKLMEYIESLDKNEK